jgi:hypothetical protein
MNGILTEVTVTYFVSEELLSEKTELEIKCLVICYSLKVHDQDFSIIHLQSYKCRISFLYHLTFPLQIHAMLMTIEHRKNANV